MKAVEMFRTWWSTHGCDRLPPRYVGVRVDVRRRAARSHRQARRRPRALDRGRVRREGPRPGRLDQPCDRVPVREPADRTVLRRRRGAGDTLAIHFVSIEPSRDWAASCTVDLFGALSTTHQTATLHEPLPERVWIYDVDGPPHRHLPSHRRRSRRDASAGSHARHGRRRTGHRSKPDRRSSPTPTGETWTPPRCEPVSRATSA